MTSCGFLIAWHGPCSQEVPCQKHENLTCSRNCGKPAKGECECTAHFLVCGAKLCLDCKCSCCGGISGLVRAETRGSVLEPAAGSGEVEAPDPLEEEAQAREALAEKKVEVKVTGGMTRGQIDAVTRQVQAQLIKQARRNPRYVFFAGSKPREKEKPVQSITYEELVQALKSVRLWGQLGSGTIHDIGFSFTGSDDIAYRFRVLHPEDMARDIFISATVAKEKQHQDE